MSSFRVHANSCVVLLQHPEDYMCSSCKTPGTSAKVMLVNSAPRILCILLKRFKFINGVSSKDSRYISFPLDLYIPEMARLRPERRGASEQPNYTLTAFLVHSGGLSSGHYIAYVRHAGQWFKYDDSQSTRVSPRCLWPLLFSVYTQLLRIVPPVP